MMEQYPEKLENKPRSRKIIYIFIGIFILTAAAVSVFFLMQKGTVCGNGVCEPFETPDECCIDCECWGKGEVCDISLNKCKVREIKITDERIEELVLDYFNNKSKEVDSMKIGDLITWENKLGKNVMVYVKGQESFISIVVMEDERVIEFEG